MGLIPAISFDSETFATVFATMDRVTGMTAFLNKENPFLLTGKLKEAPRNDAAHRQTIYSIH